MATTTRASVRLPTHQIRKQPRERDRFSAATAGGCREGARLARADKLFGPSQLVAPQWSGTWQDPLSPPLSLSLSPFASPHTSPLVTTHYIYLSSAYALVSRVHSPPPPPPPPPPLPPSPPPVSGSWHNVERLRHYGNTRASRRRRSFDPTEARVVALIRRSLSTLMNHFSKGN